MFDIRPYQGVGSLVFGTSPAEVHAVLGPPVRTRSSNYERIDTFQGFTVAYSGETGQFVEAAFSSAMDVRFHGINLFTASAAVEMLTVADGVPMEGLGFIVFLNLGIALADFDSEQESDRAVQVFERGRWDSIKSLKPYAPAAAAEPKK